MQVDMPKPAPVSWRAFAGEFAMIVLSILTALALEHGAQSVYRRGQADLSVTRMELEIRENIKEIDDALASNQASIARLKQMRDHLRNGLRAGPQQAPAPELVQQALDLVGGTMPGAIIMPHLRSEAWEVAIANQSASWLPPEQLRRYFTSYSLQRSARQELPMQLQLSINGPNLLTQIANQEIGRLEPVALYQLVTQLIAAHGQLNASLTQLRNALGNNAAPPARA